MAMMLVKRQAALGQAIHRMSPVRAPHARFEIHLEVFCDGGPQGCYKLVFPTNLDRYATFSPQF
jgi:hypothetical protein